MKKKKGFTLIELLVVIAIIGILVSITSIRFRKQLAKAQDSKAITLLAGARTGNAIMYTEKAIGHKYQHTFRELKGKLDTRTRDLIGQEGEILVGGIESEEFGYNFGGQVYLSDNNGRLLENNQIVQSMELNLTTGDDEDKSSEGKLWINY